MPQPKLPTYTWHNTMREAIIAGVGIISGTGEHIATALDILWPADQKTVFELAEKEIDKRIQARILSYEQGNINGMSEAIHRSFKGYLDNGQQASDLKIVNNNAENLYTHLNKSKYRRHLMPWIVSAFHIHMMIKKEYAAHQKAIYKGKLTWQRDVTRTYEDYRKLIDRVYSDWHNWRAAQIQFYNDDDESTSLARYNRENPPNNSQSLRMKDDNTGEEVTYEYYSSDSNAPNFTRAGWALYTRILRWEEARIADQVAPSWEAHKLFPKVLGKNAKLPKPSLQYLIIGPFSSCTLGGASYFGSYGPFTLNKDQQSARPVTAMNIKAGEIVSGLQFIHEDGKKGTMMGGNKHGKSHHFSTTEGTHKGRTIGGVKLKFTRTALLSLEVLTDKPSTDTQYSGKMGNTKRLPGPEATIKLSENFALVGSKWREKRYDMGDSDYESDLSTTGIGVLSFYFLYQPPV